MAYSSVDVSASQVALGGAYGGATGEVLWSKQRQMLGSVDISVRDITAGSGIQWESARLYVWLCNAAGTPIWSRNLPKQWGNPTPWLRITGSPFVIPTQIRLKTLVEVKRPGGYSETYASWNIWIQWSNSF